MFEPIGYCLHCGAPIDNDALDVVGSAVCEGDDGFFGVHDFDIDYYAED